MLTYKFINTFIDDLFAFVIKMPTMYRLGCFRDDIVFLVWHFLLEFFLKFLNFQVYIYQRWIYRVDKKRLNEYGSATEDPTDGGNQIAIEDIIKPSEEPSKNPENTTEPESKKTK